MSDGPHRGLKMRRGWRRFAERADKAAYAPEEVCEALPDALEQDWRAEISSRLLRQIQEILQDGQSSLFGDHRVEKLEAIRSGTAGYPLENTFLDCAIHTATEGKVGNEALTDAASATLMDRSIRGMRQIEEHCRRQYSDTRATNVRERMREGIGRTDFRAIAGDLIGTGNAERRRSLRRREGLDDGVSLR